MKPARTIKNAHSPAGMGFYVGASYRTLKDCPTCKYGTVDLRPTDRDNPDGEKVWRCADCGATFAADAL